MWSVYQELEDERDRYYAMRLFVDRMMHMKISKTAIAPEMAEGRVHFRSLGNVRPIINPCNI